MNTLQSLIYIFFQSISPLMLLYWLTVGMAMQSAGTSPNKYQPTS